MKGIRVRLLAVVLAALAPGVALAYLTRAEDRRQQMAQAHERALELANLVALEEARLVEGIRHALFAMSSSPAVANMDSTACGSWLRRVISDFESNPRFNVAVADLQGNVVCSAAAMGRPVNIADRPYFRDAVQHGGFAVGAYQDGRILGRPTVDFAYPIPDARGHPRGVVFAALGLDRLHELEADVAARLPPGTTLTKIDGDGRILARLPDQAQTVGQVAFPAAVLGPIQAAPSGVFVQPGADGARHLYAFSRVPSTGTSGRIFVVLSRSEAATLAHSSRRLRGNLLALAVAALLAVALTWAVSERLIVRPARQLVAVLGRLAAGEFAPGSGRGTGRSIADLARSLEDMAAGLDRREAERRAAEETLRASEERYRSLFENAHDIVFTVDLDGRLTSLNRAGEAILGHSRDAAVGMDVMQLVAPDDRRVAAQMLERRRAGDEAARMYEIEMLTGDGGRVPLEVGSQLVLQEGRPASIQAIARDVGERKRLQAQLAQAQKIEAVGRLAGGVAHDFNNLLGVIIGYCELMERDRLDERARKRLGEIRDAAVRAAALTRQLLAFSRRQVLEPRVLDLNAVVADSATLIERVIGEDIALRAKLAESLGTVRADPSQVEQVILNLAVNARDAMVSGGSLSIETANSELDEAYAAVHPGASPGRYVMLAVSDTGTGMDAQTLARIFDPFFTTKPSGQGTGLGLATVYGVVKQSGGYISVYSELGHGTTFKIYLPRVDAPPEPRAVRVAEAAVAGGSETILLVEDDAALRDLTRESLQEAGYTVLGAPSAFAALEAARLHAGRIELLLTDVVLPGMNGRALADQLAGLVPEVKVLFVSGYSDDAIARHGVLEPDIRFLSKPYTHEQLLRKVREVLDQASHPGQGGV